MSNELCPESWKSRERREEKERAGERERKEWNGGRERKRDTGRQREREREREREEGGLPERESHLSHRNVYPDIDSSPRAVFS